MRAARHMLRSLAYPTAVAKLEDMPSGLILAIESSCDETAAAVVERGSRTLSR
jgi:hypothetical protein